MRKRSIAAIGLAAVAFTLGGGTAAQAHDTKFQWYACGAVAQNCGTAYISNSHRTLKVCDEEADGLGFRTAYQRSDGKSGIISDGNGASAGCGSGTAPTGVVITKVRLIQQNGDLTIYLGSWHTV